MLRQRLDYRHGWYKIRYLGKSVLAHLYSAARKTTKLTVSSSLVHFFLNVLQEKATTCTHDPKTSCITALSLPLVVPPFAHIQQQQQQQQRQATYNTGRKAPTTTNQPIDPPTHLLPQQNRDLGIWGSRGKLTISLMSLFSFCVAAA
jgi:hypothetical protein